MRGYICKNFSEYINSDDNILDFYEKRKITYQTILYTLVNNKVIRDIHSDTWIEKFGMLNPFCVIRKKYFFDHVTCTYQSIKSDLTKNIFIVFHRKHKILRPEINLDNDKLTCDFHVLKPIENKILCNREFIQPDKKLELVYTTYNCMFNQNVIKEKYLSFNDGNLELYIKDRKLYINCDKIGDYKVYVDLTNEKK
jgi:hypothetical protein